MKIHLLIPLWNWDKEIIKQRGNPSAAKTSQSKINLRTDEWKPLPVYAFLPRLLLVVTSQEEQGIQVTLIGKNFTTGWAVNPGNKKNIETNIDLFHHTWNGIIQFPVNTIGKSNKLQTTHMMRKRDTSRPNNKVSPWGIIHHSPPEVGGVTFFVGCTISQKNYTFFYISNSVA